MYKKDEKGVHHIRRGKLMRAIALYNKGDCSDIFFFTVRERIWVKIRVAGLGGGVWEDGGLGVYSLYPSYGRSHKPWFVVPSLISMFILILSCILVQVNTEDCGLKFYFISINWAWSWLWKICFS